MLIWEQEDTDATPPDGTLPPGGLTQKLLYWNPVTNKWEPISIGAGLQVVNGELVATGGGSNSSISLTYPNNGLIQHLGTNGGTETFANPVPTKLIGLMSSNVIEAFPGLTGYAVEQTTNKIDDLPAHTNNISNSWIGFRLPSNKKINITEYIVKSRSDANSNHPTGWILEISNNIAVNTVAGWNAATWSTIDTRTGLSFSQNELKNFTATAIDANAWRWRQQSFNSNNENWFIVGELDVFGTYYP